MQIRKLTSQCRITEADSAARKIIEACEKGNWSEEPHMTTLLEELTPLSGDLNTAINRSRLESILDEKDTLRDEQMRSLYYLVQGYLHHPAADMSAAAKPIFTLLNRYGLEIIRESYDAESSLITSLITDLADYTEEIALLPGVPERIDALNSAQEEFNRTALEWEEGQASERRLPSATQLKKELLDVINDRFVVYLQAMAQLDPDRYGSLADTVAEIIESTNSIIERRAADPAVQE